MALLELHVDVGEGLADALAERDQPVIRAKREKNENDKDAENDPAGRHGNKLLMGQTNVDGLAELQARGSRHEVVSVLSAARRG
jgi:hypothetical protein